MTAMRVFQAYVIPLCVYQTVAIAGGYGTGREVVEFFTRSGAKEGIYGLSVSALVLALITALTFEFGRLVRAYDYRTFFRALIGRFWVGFEACYLFLFIIVIAVVASAAGTVFSDQLGISELPGLLLMLSVIGALAYFGREWVERVMIALTLLLFTAFIFYFVSIAMTTGDPIAKGYVEDYVPAQANWLGPALKFAFYSAPVAPLVLFATRGISTRSQALVSGGLCGLAFMVPGFLFHLSFLHALPQVIVQAVPVYWLIENLHVPFLLPVYLVAMLGTFIGTAAGFIQALNERLDSWVRDRAGKSLPSWAHSGVAVGGFLISAGLGQFGIIALIAKGYGSVAWGFLVFFIIPMLTVGVHRIFFKPRAAPGAV